MDDDELKERLLTEALAFVRHVRRRVRCNVDDDWFEVGLISADMIGRADAILIAAKAADITFGPDIY